MFDGNYSLWRSTVAYLCALGVSIMPSVPAAKTAAPNNDLGAALRRQLLAHGYPVAADKRLDEAARSHSAALAELGGQPVDAASEHLRFLLHRLGVADAAVRAHSFAIANQHALLAQIGQRSLRLVRGGITHLGLGTSRRGARIIVTLVGVRRRVALLHREGGICVRPLLPARVQLLLTFPNGSVRQLHTKRSRRGHCAQLAPGPHGRYQLEVMLHGPGGPEVAALLPLYRGIPWPKGPTAKLYPERQRTAIEIESRLFEVLNRTRAALHLRKLAPSTRLTIAARAHSADMLHSGYFGHVSPLRGPLEQRLRAHGLPLGAIQENLALARSALQAHDALLNSPGHRRSLLDPRLRSLGVGAARDKQTGLYYLCMLLAAEEQP